MAKRRERGSVAKRGDAWLVRVSAGTDPVTGKRLWLCGTCGSPQEAEKLRTKFLGQVDGRKAGRTRASLGALLDDWLPGMELGPNTRDNYAGLINRFIRPALGDLPLSRITPQRIERFYGELRRCRSRCDGRPFVGTLSEGRARLHESQMRAAQVSTARAVVGARVACHPQWPV